MFGLKIKILKYTIFDASLCGPFLSLLNHPLARSPTPNSFVLILVPCREECFNSLPIIITELVLHHHTLPNSNCIKQQLCRKGIQRHDVRWTLRHSIQSMEH